MSRPRLLPITIAGCGLLLVTKVLGVGMSFVPQGWTLAAAVMPPAVAASHEKPAQPAPGGASQGEGHGAAQPPAAAPATTAPPIPAPVKLEPPPPQISPEEVQLLQDLRSRRKEWDARDRTLAERAGVVAAAEQRLVSRAAELADLQARLEQMEKARAERDDANWIGLVRMYEAMKPRDAAAIFNDLDMPVLLQLMDRMKEAKAASVVAAMQPDRARLLTSQLAAKRDKGTTIPDRAAAVPTTQGAAHS